MAAVVEGVQLLQVAGHTYRVRTTPITSGGRGQRQQQQQQQQPQQDWQVEEELALLAEESGGRGGDAAAAAAADDTVDDPLITQEGSGFTTQIVVDPELFGFVIGRGGNTKKEIEAATGTTIHCGKPAGQRKDGRGHKQQQQQAGPGGVLLGGGHSEPITIRAPTRQAVSSARTRVQLLLDGVINSRLVDWTHFVSIPLSNEHTAAKLQQFQDKVLAQPDAHRQRLEPSMFISPKTLHLTLLMLKLCSDEARHRAAQTLQALGPELDALLRGKPLQLSLKGLDYMSDDPTDMHVLYLKVAEQAPGKSLQALCDLVVAAFKDAGLMLPGQPSSVKLHATIINTRHRRPPRDQQQQQQQDGRQQQQRQQQQRHQQQQQRLGFRGQALLDAWADLDLGAFKVPALHVSKRGAYDAGSGYYASLASVALPA